MIPFDAICSLAALFANESHQALSASSAWPFTHFQLTACFVTFSHDANTHLQAYGHRIRELVLFAAMEVEGL
jgi:hypothetical protein